MSVALQVGVNYANDYSDGIRGTDGERVGPVRLVGQHLADPANVKLMAFAFFGFAALVGLALVALSEAWSMLPLGALAVLAAWKYTGGDNPYGYRGLGEVYVFLFFGLMATLGTLYTQAGELTWVGVAGAVGVGAIATAILVVNNLRDIPTDRESGKLTLAVRLGDQRTRWFYALLILVAVAMVVVVAPPAPARLDRAALARAALEAPAGAAQRRHRARPRAGARRDRPLRGRVCRAARRRASPSAPERRQVSRARAGSAVRRVRLVALVLGVLGGLVGAADRGAARLLGRGAPLDAPGQLGGALLAEPARARRRRAPSRSAR